MLFMSGKELLLRVKMTYFNILDDFIDYEKATTLSWKERFDLSYNRTMNGFPTLHWNLANKEFGVGWVWFEQSRTECMMASIKPLIYWGA